MLELRVETGITKIQEELKILNDIKNIDQHSFYGKYTDPIKQLNTIIQLRKAEHKDYLNNLEKALNEKKRNLFVKTDPLTLNEFDDFSIVIYDHVSNLKFIPKIFSKCIQFFNNSNKFEYVLLKYRSSFS